MANRQNKNRRRNRRHRRRSDWLHPSGVFESDTCPPELSGTFWHEGVARPEGPWTSHYQRLLNAGVHLPDVDGMNDRELQFKLQELIEAMARLRVYMTMTNHLDDRGLYRQLTKEALHDPIRDVPIPADAAFMLVMLGMHKFEHLMTYLTYYASDDERRELRIANPQLQLPARKKSPSNRDATLPKPNVPSYGLN